MMSNFDFVDNNEVRDSRAGRAMSSMWELETSDFKSLSLANEKCFFKNSTARGSDSHATTFVHPLESAVRAIDPDPANTSRKCPPSSLIISELKIDSRIRVVVGRKPLTSATSIEKPLRLPDVILITVRAPFWCRNKIGDAPQKDLAILLKGIYFS